MAKSQKSTSPSSDGDAPAVTPSSPYFLVTVSEFGAAKCTEFQASVELAEAAREAVKTARQIFVFRGERWRTSMPPFIWLISPVGTKYALFDPPDMAPVENPDGYVSEDIAESFEVVAPAATSESDSPFASSVDDAAPAALPEFDFLDDIEIGH
jgi:hypothetical protein